MPAAPFEALTLDDLDTSVVASSYTEAVIAAVASRGGKAFVVEGVYEPTTDWRSSLGPRLAALTPSNATLTRSTSVIARGSLDTDVSSPPRSRRLPAASS